MLTDLNDKVRSHKVDWNVGVELCHKLPEVDTKGYFITFNVIHYLMNI